MEDADVTSNFKRTNEQNLRIDSLMKLRRRRKFKFDLSSSIITQRNVT